MALLRGPRREKGLSVPMSGRQGDRDGGGRPGLELLHAVFEPLAFSVGSVELALEGSLRGSR